MLIALVILNIVHPGRVMPGQESELPSRRDRKKNGISKKADKLITMQSPVEEVMVERNSCTACQSPNVEDIHLE